MLTNDKLNHGRVADLHRTMAGHVERGEIPGIVTLLARGDDLHVDAVGTMTVGGGAPTRRDSIFRIASITKPIAAASTIILVDDGRFQLESF